MKNQKLFEMIRKFADLSNNPSDNEFQAQRERLTKFKEKFREELMRVIYMMEDEIGTLKARAFDPQMARLLLNIFEHLKQIIQNINPEKPYLAAEKLVHYVLDKPNAPYIENLDFLAKHHLKQTNIDFKADKTPIHPEVSSVYPEIRSIDYLKKLAMELRKFMNEHPLIQLPTTPNSSPNLHKNLEEIPFFFAMKEDKTKA